MTKYPYIIVDDNADHSRETRMVADTYSHLEFAGKADNYASALDLILDVQPAIVFLEISPEDPQSQLSLHLINDAYRYLSVLPKFIITTTTKELAFEAMRFDIEGYVLKPYDRLEFRKAILKVTRQAAPALISLPIVIDKPIAENKVDADIEPQLVESAVDRSEVVQAAKEKPLTICVKSYGDYRFINADDICYLQADNNSTDIHLNNGEMITAFKTLKHFENVLKSPFVRIHNSYIVNIDYVSRIHTGNAVCYIKGTTTKLPFSKSYKENVDAILESITTGNYLEI